jgi:hypothetical protein
MFSAMVTGLGWVSRLVRGWGLVTVTARAKVTGWGWVMVTVMVTVRVRQCSQINRLPTARGFLRAGWRGCLPRVPGLMVTVTARATVRVRV